WKGQRSTRWMQTSIFGIRSFLDLNFPMQFISGPRLLLHKGIALLTRNRLGFLEMGASFSLQTTTFVAAIRLLITLSSLIWVEMLSLMIAQSSTAIKTVFLILAKVWPTVIKMVSLTSVSRFLIVMRTEFPINVRHSPTAITTKCLIFVKTSKIAMAMGLQMNAT
ncbi:MAG: hypothetical protein VX998_05980, partial [Candidatus Thermoplasmatota archaeon]|nr:hypothetical protein [Candidatus Thermoplasmatota archaeon]